MMLLWKALSALGGVTVTGPLAIAVALWLLAGRTWRLSLAWCMLFCAGMTLVVLTKVAYYGWGLGIPDWQFAGLSGHAMRATAVYPVVFFLAFRNAGSPARHAALAAGVLLAGLIAYSRLPVQAHTLSEVLLGGAVGYGTALAFIAAARSEQPAVVGRVLATLCMPVVVVMPFTKPAPAEKWVKQVAVYLSGKDPVEHAWRKSPDYQRFRKEQEAI